MSDLEVMNPCFNGPPFLTCHWILHHGVLNIHNRQMSVGTATLFVCSSQAPAPSWHAGSLPHPPFIIITIVANKGMILNWSGENFPGGKACVPSKYDLLGGKMLLMQWLHTLNV